MRAAAGPPGCRVGGAGVKGGDVAQAGTLLRRVFYSRKALDILASPTPFRSLRPPYKCPGAPNQQQHHIEPGRFGIQLRFRSSPSLPPSALVSPPRATCVPSAFPSLRRPPVGLAWLCCLVPSLPSVSKLPLARGGPAPRRRQSSQIRAIPANRRLNFSTSLAHPRPGSIGTASSSHFPSLV
jgi:hypothetical protein